MVATLQQLFEAVGANQTRFLQGGIVGVIPNFFGWGGRPGWGGGSPPPYWPAMQDLKDLNLYVNFNHPFRSIVNCCKFTIFGNLRFMIVGIEIYV